MRALLVLVAALAATVLLPAAHHPHKPRCLHGASSVAVTFVDGRLVGGRPVRRTGCGR